MEQRRQVTIDGISVWVAPPEYVIVRKFEFFQEGQSEKHLTDIAAMLRISGDLIDNARLGAWIARLGLDTEWQLARARA